ncbi:transcriptional regulator [Paenisporosarcina quisquiliarum]|nr:transcriptional regulator [Paenisporosarcina quisquiliarum]
MINLQNARLIFDKYHLTSEFVIFLEDLIIQKEKSGFSQLSRLHYQINGGIETASTEEVFRMLDLFILITDILDDIEDDEVKKWGYEYNLLVNGSTALLSIILLELQQIKLPYQNEVLRLFFNYLLSATDGQHHDLTNQIISEKEYFDIVKKKSGSIIALSCTLGQTLVTGKITLGLETYAQHVAIIAQIRNDYEDLLGKQKDLLSKKRTLPILYLLQYEDPMYDHLRDYYSTNKSLDFSISVNEIEKSGLTIYLNLITLKYRNLALELLQSLYPEQDLSKLEQLI